MSGNFFKFNLIHNLYHQSIYNIPALSDAECLAELQANKKCMEEQEAELRVAMEEEQRAAEAAKKAEEEQVAVEKKVAKKLSKKWKTAEPAAGQEAEGSEALKKKLKVKALDEDAELPAETTIVACKQ